MARTRWTGAAALVLAAAAVVVLTACGGGEKGTSETADSKDRAWVCEACGHTFAAPDAKGVQECPACGKEAAIRSVTYKCLKCGKTFEAYRLLDTTGLDKPKGPDGKPIEPGTHVKRKGGEWVRDEEMLGTIECPHCGNDNPNEMTFGSR
ncbi:MAG: hypothetical protein ACODAJ_05770 [Planctomycetota bacterium]